MMQGMESDARRMSTLDGHGTGVLSEAIPPSPMGLSEGGLAVAMSGGLGWRLLSCVACTPVRYLYLSSIPILPTYPISSQLSSSILSFIPSYPLYAYVADR